jgi:hypothetical protein
LSNNNISASALFEKFNEEINKPKPNKGILEKLSENFKVILPAAASLASDFTKIISIIG